MPDNPSSTLLRRKLALECDTDFGYTKSVGGATSRVGVNVLVLQAAGVRALVLWVGQIRPLLQYALRDVITQCSMGRYVRHSIVRERSLSAKWGFLYYQCSPGLYYR